MISMESCYRALRYNVPAPPHWGEIETCMEEFLRENPESTGLERRSALYGFLAEHAKPTLFADNAFFFETQLRRAESWGVPGGDAPGSYLHNRRPEPTAAELEARKALYDFALYNQERETLFWCCYGGNGFDSDHHSPGYGRLLPRGLNAFRAEIAERLKQRECAEWRAMLAGIDAMLRIAARFATAIGAALSTAAPEDRFRLERMLQAARRVPAEAPQTFYEGLQFLLFVREVMASLECIGLSVLGRPDLLLIDLYNHDLQTGRLTEEEARTLIGDWMAPHDIKCFVRERDWPETSTCVELGGCDAEGNAIYNDLTRLFIDVHVEKNFFNPKLNCRYSAASPAAYLEQASRHVLAGHNHFAFLNDDVLIPALMRHGKSLEDARNYVNGGCQETIAEGTEHSAGAFFYLGLPEVFHCFLTRGKTLTDGGRAKLACFMPDYAPDAATFEDLYNATLRMFGTLMQRATALSGVLGANFHAYHPCPLFSVSLAGCVENGKDYTAGGARYNPSGMSLLGLADLVNSLYALKQSVYVEKFITLSSLRDALACNFEGLESLRQRLEAMPRYGWNLPEVDALAGRLAADLTALTRALPNERGGYFQPGFFVYWMFKHFGDATHATPDGRRSKMILSQGIAPSRVRAPQSLTEVFGSLQSIDFRDVPGNAVLDVALPLGGGITPEMLTEVLRCAGSSGIPTLQPDCVDAALLKAAHEAPGEEYAHIAVRISGLSAVFIRLRPEVRKEIIERAGIAP